MATAFKNKKLIIGIAIILIAAAGAVAYWQYAKSKKSPDSQHPTQSESTTTEDSNIDGHSDHQASETGEESTEVPVKNYESITENEAYTIRRETGTNKYLITLYAIINRPEQHDQYHDQLREYKQQALQYLSSHGQNPDTLEINYEPAEAKDL